MKNLRNILFLLILITIKTSASYMPPAVNFLTQYFTKTESDARYASISVAAQVNSDWNSGSGLSQVLNKPAIPSTTTDITEGTRLYWTAMRFTNQFAAQTTDGLSEGFANLYYTDTRARAATTLTTTGSAGIATWSGGTLNIPNYSSKTFNNAPARSLVVTAAAANGWQVSATTNASVTYSATISCAVQIGVVTNIEGYVVLEIAATNSTTAADWKEISRVSSGQNISLALALATTAKSGGSVSGQVPAGWYTRIRSVNVAGTPTYVVNSGQETY